MSDLDNAARVPHNVSMDINETRIQLRNVETGYAEVWDRDSGHSFGKVRRDDMTKFWEAYPRDSKEPLAASGLDTRDVAIRVLVGAVKGAALPRRAWWEEGA